MQFPPLTLPCIFPWVIESADAREWRNMMLDAGSFGREAEGARVHHARRSRLCACRARMGEEARRRGGLGNEFPDPRSPCRLSPERPSAITTAMPRSQVSSLVVGRGVFPHPFSPERHARWGKQRYQNSRLTCPTYSRNMSCTARRPLAIICLVDGGGSMSPS